MFKFKKAIATTVSVIAVSILMNAPKANAARVYTTVSEYGDSAVAPAYFGGEDSDNSGSLTVAELTEYSLSFTGNSQVAAFNFGLEDILVSDPSRLPSGQYVYGNSLLDTSDDISLPYQIFFAKPQDNLFIEIRGTNDYLANSGFNEIKQYSSDSFSVVLGSTSSNQLVKVEKVEVAAVPEPPVTWLGFSTVLGVGLLLKRRNKKKLFRF